MHFRWPVFSVKLRWSYSLVSCDVRLCYVLYGPRLLPQCERGDT